MIYSSLYITLSLLNWFSESIINKETNLLISLSRKTKLEILSR